MLKPMLRHCYAWLPFRFGCLNVAVMLLQLPALWLGFDWSGDYSLERIGVLVTYGLVGLLAIQLPLQLLALFAARRRWVRLCVSICVLVAYDLLVAHRVRTHSDVDWSALESNAALSAEAFGVGLDTLDLRILVSGGCILATIILFESCGRPVIRPLPAPRWRHIFLCVAAYASIVLLQLPSFDETSRVLQAAWRRATRATQNAIVIRPHDYPLVRVSDVHPSATARKPDVFLLLVESFRAHHVERKADNGKWYTPFFNELLQRGLYIEHFYGNSIQTRKGQFASLCSVIPSVSGSEFDEYGKNHYECLPRILTRHGYETTFFQAYRKLSYDRTGQFMRDQGFASVDSVEKYALPEDKESNWGWGLQDDRFYQRFFEYLDTRTPEEIERPQFITLAPIGNHMRFNKVPQDRQHIHPRATSIYERYANSVYLADLGLREFFAQLERRPRFREAVVIVTGDHSYPLGEHGYDMNTAAAFEEFFRIPLLVIWPGVVQRERVRAIPYSQLDIAPTILELAGVQPERTHFMGLSMFSRPRRIRPVPLVQPYSGRYLAVVEYPYKYIYQVETGKAQLFDLARDPGESRDLATRLEFGSVRSTMHQLLRPTFLVQAALEADRVWPSDSSSDKVARR